MELRFISKNDGKLREAQSILGAAGIRVIPKGIEINELQTDDSFKLIHHKVLEAFKKIGRPLFVEHTGLYIRYMNGFPGALTQLFWDSLGSERFTELFHAVPDRRISAKTSIGYFDGTQIYYFHGEIQGVIAPEPRGSRDFQWDCIFIPDGFDQTFAEMGEQKHEISMRRIALDKLAQFISGR